MPKMKSKRIAVPTNLLKRTTYTMSIRSVKAFLFPFTQVYWGAQEDMNFTERKSSKIYIDIEDFAEVVGYSMSSRITTEIRKIIRKMNKELYGSEDSHDILFSYEGTSKDKKQFIIKIHKPKEIYNIKENCSSYIQIDADDIFRCQTIYDYRILYFVLCSKEDNHNGFVHKTITPDTYFLKYWVFNMTMYENCYTNKKHPDYNELMLKTIEYYYDELAKDEIDQNRFNEELDCFARNNGYGNRENLLRAFSNVVSFTNRTRLENYLQHGLEILNQGTMFEVIQNKKTGKLFKKIKINGYRVDHYEIKVWKKH